MPNHCINTLRVVGPPDEPKHLDEFQEKAKGIAPYDEGIQEKRPDGVIVTTFKPLLLSCDKFVPMPRVNGKLIDFSSKGKGSGEKDIDGYSWCINNWGTKWGAYDVSSKRELYSLEYVFQTAWAPLTPVVMAMSQQHPELTFHHDWEEPGCSFEGTFVVKAGNILERSDRDYIPTCMECEEKKEDCIWDEEHDEGYICKQCKKERDEEGRSR